MRLDRNGRGRETYHPGEVGSRHGQDPLRRASGQDQAIRFQTLQPVQPTRFDREAGRDMPYAASWQVQGVAPAQCGAQSVALRPIRRVHRAGEWGAEDLSAGRCVLVQHGDRQPVLRSRDRRRRTCGPRTDDQDVVAGPAHPRRDTIPLTVHR